MNPSQAQSDSEWNGTHFASEESGAGEQFFAAQPKFAPGSLKGPSAGRDPGPSRGAAGPASHPSQTSGFDPDPSPIPSPGAAEEAGQAKEKEKEKEKDKDKEEEKTREAQAEPRTEPDLDSDWRNIVSAKVKRYQRLRPRKQRYPSLAFEFDSASSSNAGSRNPQGSQASSPVETGPPRPAGENGPPVLMEPAREARMRRLLEFPRPGMLPFNRDELAEPVVDRERIMDAPELVPPPPALGGILIEPSREPAEERPAGAEVRVRAAPLSGRAFAFAFDAVLVGVGLAGFLCVFLRFHPALPGWRTSAELLALLGGMLWFAYQSAFLIVCGTTPGLCAARLKLTRFDGGPVPRNSRRWRVVASLLSAVSLALGYAWCFFDENRLSWHDRITKTLLEPAD